MSADKPVTYGVRLKRYHRQRWLIAAVVVLLILAVRLITTRCGLPLCDRSDDFARYNSRTVRCVKVVDGDTIDIDIPDHRAQEWRAYTRIRLWGIDTPELPHHGREAMYYAYEATEFARKLMAGKAVRLELIENETRGYYGRLLAYVHLSDGRMYNREAVKHGYAYADHRFAHPLRDEFLAVQSQAQGELAGLWRAVTVDQLPKWFRHKTLDGFWLQRKRLLTQRDNLQTSTLSADR